MKMGPGPYRRRLVLAFAGLIASLSALVFVGCARAELSPAAREDRLVVFAAVSLRDVFTALGDDFRRVHPDVALTFNFAGTQELHTQLEHGTAADVFASADQRHMDALARAGRISGPVIFARNEPVVIVARESAATLRAFGDLPTASSIVIGTPGVPIGRYTLEILDRASATLGADFRSRVETRVVSREINVRQVLMKVGLGEAQAGFVYRTDALAARDRVGIVTIPPDINVIASYPIAVVSGAAHPTLARAWVDLVLSAQGRQALRSVGFLAPSGGGSAP